MTELVGYLILFLGVGVFFLFFHLMVGKLIRPNKPEADKLTIYECGEPTIGSAWVQFDLRFYVVALLFVIFDVEVAFFFPWAVVFGKANALANNASVEGRLRRGQELDPKLHVITEKNRRRDRAYWEARPAGTTRDRRLRQIDASSERLRAEIPEAAHQLAWFAFWDILVFFAVLLVGFAYLWRRGDLDWVRSTAAEKAQAAPQTLVNVSTPAIVVTPGHALPVQAKA